ncbi:MAG: hypothetical protein O3B01_28005 [Planctomycetota bacterium]|nr:hypothetical protein [Planctomycetota bacterium]
MGSETWNKERGVDGDWEQAGVSSGVNIATSILTTAITYKMTEIAILSAAVSIVPAAALGLEYWLFSYDVEAVTSITESRQKMRYEAVANSPDTAIQASVNRGSYHQYDPAGSWAGASQNAAVGDIIHTAFILECGVKNKSYDFYPTLDALGRIQLTGQNIKDTSYEWQ